MRKVHINNQEWLYRVGKGNIVIFSPIREKYVVDFSKLLGLSWEAIERYFWKCSGTDHPANIKPGAVKKWIIQNIIK